jgi:hypothetical protein
MAPGRIRSELGRRIRGTHEKLGCSLQFGLSVIAGTTMQTVPPAQVIPKHRPRFVWVFTSDSETTALAGVEDVYREENSQYSADPSIRASLSLSPRVTVTAWSANERGWTASASDDSNGATCYLSGRASGRGSFAVLDEPTCGKGLPSHTTRDAFGRQRPKAPQDLDRRAAPAFTAEPSTSVTSASILLPAGSSIPYVGYPVRTVDRLAVRRLLLA